jgi:hypothetical protein
MKKEAVVEELAKLLPLLDDAAFLGLRQMARSDNDKSGQKVSPSANLKAFARDKIKAQKKAE